MSTSSKWIVAAGCVGLATASASSALAQTTTTTTTSTVRQERAETPSYFSERIRAPKDALELGVGAAYSQGTMSPAEGVGSTDLTKAGGAFSLQVGYRFVPHFGLSIFGEFNEFTPGNALAGDAKTRGGVAGINATAHLLPFDRIDPWVRLGTGYRMLWVTGTPDVPDTRWHGFQLAKLDIGADLRTSEDVAIGPTIGVGLNQFFWRNPEGDAGNEEISGKRLVPFVYAGIEARFDIAGARRRPVSDIASR
jgi:hypothetical protein